MAAEPLPPFPAIARKLLSAVAQDDCPMRNIAELVGSDAAFSVEVLRLANSSIFGLRYEVISILHAVSVLGTNRLRGLILTVGLRDFLRSTRHDELVKRCWRHNLATALTAEWVGDAAGVDRAVAYTAGLLHDVGRLALLTMYPGRYLQVLQLYKKGVGDLLTCEKEAIGLDHRQIGQRLWKEWNLPTALVATACEDHCVHTGNAFGMEGIVAASCTAATELGFSMLDPTPPGNLAAILEASVPPEVWAKLAPGASELKELIPAKLLQFETEFLT